MRRCEDWYFIKKDITDLVKGRGVNLYLALLSKYCGCSSPGVEMGERKKGERTIYKRGCLMKRKITDSMDSKMKERFIRAMCYPPYPMTRHHDPKVKMLTEFYKILENGEKFIVFGCGGHARSIVEVIHEIDMRAEIVLVDGNANANEMILGCKVKREYEIDVQTGYIMAVGNNQKRRELYQQVSCKNKGHCITLAARDSYVGEEAKIGRGTFIAHRAYIGPQAEVGDNTIINTGSIIEHEVKIGSHTHIAPNATICGRTVIGDNVLVGAGSTIIDKINVCSGTIIGAGAVVTTDISEQGKYVGIPARRI